MPKIVVVLGGQFGSESKGLIAAQICRDRNIDLAVRTGAVNAGHTVYHNGNRVSNQQLPVGWTNLGTKLVVGSGAYVYPEILEREVKQIEAITGENLHSRIIIDERAGLHTDEHMGAEAGLHERMGSTGEGCGEALKDKISRRAEYKQFSQTEHAKGYLLTDTSKLLNEAYDAGESIMLEGTQGTLLDLHFGYYPYVTSRQTIASAWAAESGLSPALDYEVVMVCRTMPIRVAGNSGPFEYETSWPDLADRINSQLINYGHDPLVDSNVVQVFRDTEVLVKEELGMPGASICHYSDAQRAKFSTELSTLHRLVFEKLSEADRNELKKLFEFTTVTKKLRRIADWSDENMQRAVQLNRPSSIALTFLNYLFPTCWGIRTWEELEKCPEYSQILQYLHKIRSNFGVPISYVNCAPDCVISVPINHQQV